MKRLYIIALIFLASSLGAAEFSTKSVRLENGHELIIKTIQPSRILPHAFYDQAMSSMPGVYPHSKIIAKRRIGYLRKNPAILYSMVSYKESVDQAEVTISGVVIQGANAWSFEATIPEASFSDSLLLVMESLADLPFNRSLQPGVESGG